MAYKYLNRQVERLADTGHGLIIRLPNEDHTMKIIHSKLYWKSAGETIYIFGAQCCHGLSTKQKVRQNSTSQKVYPARSKEPVARRKGLNLQVEGPNYPERAH